MIGTHAVIVAADLELTDPVDISCLVDQVSIVHGRDDTGTQPEASTATIDITLDSATEALPAALDVGAIVKVSTTLPGVVESTRLVGRVTDVTLSWADAGPETPDALVAQVIVASTLSELGRRIVGDIPWPVELDGARVARILTAAGVTTDPALTDPGTVNLIARDVDASAALELAQSAAESAGGVLWSTRDGQILYADAAHRRAAIAGLTLDSCDVLVSPAWSRNTAGMTNTVSIGYGLESGPDGEQPRYLATNAASVARYGRYELSTSTDLADLADAQAMATLMVTRGASPVWIMAALPVDLEALDQARTEAVLALDMHSLIELTGLPSAGTAPTSTSLWVEGWSETLAYGVHDLDLYVSGYCRTVPAPRWDDVNPATTWDSVGTLTWDDATCLGPQPSAGRWSDVPATLRWDQIPPATLWDDWK